MITQSIPSNASVQYEPSQGTVSTVVIGLSVLLLGFVISVVAINCLMPVVSQMADIVMALRY